MYDLSTNGARDFLRYTALLSQRKVPRDPLSGLVDGANTVFLTQYSPILSSGSLTAYDSSGSVVATSSVDYDTGEVVFPSAPSYQPTATYTATPYTSWQLKSFLMAGFDEMSARWDRPNWYLSSGSSSYIAPTEDDEYIYVVLKNPSDGTLSDPPCYGSVGFSLLRAQTRFYMACCEYAYITRQLMFTAENSINFREARGASIDREQIPKNIDLAMERLERKVVAAMKVAQDQYYAGGDHLGAQISPQHTLDFETNYEWHT